MDYSSLSRAELQQLCKKEGLPATKSKQELITALTKAATLSAPAPPQIVAVAPVAPSLEQTKETAMTVPKVVSPPVPTEDCTGASLRTSSRSGRVIQARACTMCDCHTGKLNMGKPSVDASVLDLADKLATVNLVPEITSSEPIEVDRPHEPAAKPAKSTKVRSATARGPLKSKDNQSNVVAADVPTVAASPKAKQSKAKTTIKELASPNDATVTGKENAITHVQAAARPSRKSRSLKEIA